MRVFIAVLVLIFSFQSWTKADDIRDFEIEDMSVGDSLLDYFNEEEINKKDKLFYSKSKKFFSITYYNLPNFETYEEVQIHLKKDDKKYKIYSITGDINYEDNIEDCYKKKDTIVSELTKLFSDDAKKVDRGTKKHAADKTGKSKTTNVWFFLNSGGNFLVSCYEWSKEMNLKDSLRVGIDSQEFYDWLNNEAY